MNPLTIANMPFSPTRSDKVLAALEEYELPLVRYALQFLGDEASARDTVQYAFLKLLASQDLLASPRRAGILPASDLFLFTGRQDACPT